MTTPYVRELEAIRAEQELLPCPFCGGGPSIHTWPAGTINIMCSDRDCPVHVEFETGARAEAIKAWNTRHA